ncbi:MAG: fibronectin type III domain-containing protein, partial [Candidatus Falkowbacteria bacterium]|nr:fibronectin type III domain-containing protein [Candidatus Falkowbacteria bacterium]
VFARSDKYFVRLFEQYTDMVCYIFLDSSASMGYGQPFQKIEYCSFFAAALSYLFIKQGDLVSCENPWPPRDPLDGSWAPWQDNMTCTYPLGGCNNYNHELYYCRDNGKKGTYDDLPALLSDNAGVVTRGVSSNALKETYFFRENVPTATTTLVVTNEGTGGSVRAAWGAIAEPSLTGYKLYWGQGSGNYTSHQNIGSGETSFVVSGLKNNTVYYFKLTGIYQNNVENDLYNEATSSPSDTTAPAAPLNLTAATTTEGISLQWDVVSDAANYRVYYGTTDDDVYGSSQNVGKETEVVITGLSTSRTYYFAVTAIDSSGNESPYSNRVPSP